MTTNDPHLNRFLDLVVKQIEGLEGSFKELKNEVFAKIDTLGERTTKLENRVVSLEYKVEEVLKKVTVNGKDSNSSVAVEASKKLEERVKNLENEKAVDGSKKNLMVIWGKQFYIPPWLVYFILTTVSLVLGALLATGQVMAVLEFIAKLFGK